MFHRFSYTYKQAQPILADLERYLSAYAQKVPECDNPYPDRFNIYIFNNIKNFALKREKGRQINVLMYAGWMEEVPWTPTESALFIHKQANTDGTLTLSKSHVRLPQLSHLITLTPEDFFLFFRTIAGQRELLSFEITEEDIPYKFKHWFTTYYKGHRIDSKIADRRWVPRYVIDTLAMMEPNLKNQLAAMQYITVMRDDSLVSVPVSTVIALELDWEQIQNSDGTDTDYCIAEPDSQSFVLLGR